MQAVSLSTARCVEGAIMLFKAAGWASFVVFASMLAQGHETQRHLAAHIPSTRDASRTNLGPSRCVWSDTNCGIVDFIPAAVGADILARLREVRTEIEESSDKTVDRAANAHGFVTSEDRAE